jgi:hypothetical protein
MSLSDRNPYEVHAELVQRIERLETALTTLIEMWDALSRRDGPIAGQDDWAQAWRVAREALR